MLRSRRVREGASPPLWSGAAVRTAPLLVALTIWVGVGESSAQIVAPEVRNVRFEGNETFPDDSLARAIVTQETNCRSFVLGLFCLFDMDFALRRSRLRQRELPRDQARITIWYRRRGFRDVQVDTAAIVSRPDGAEVIFNVVEGVPVLADSIAFVGAEGLELSGLLSDLPLQPGDRLSTLALDATRDLLIRRLNNAGHAYADVFIQAIRPAEDLYRAQVTFDVVPGPRAVYGDIRISGLQNLSLSTIRRTLQFNSGEVYSQDEVDEARARLFGLDIVRSARVEPDSTVGPDSVVNVEVTVQEGDAYRVRAGGGHSTAECLNVEARWTSRNFLGGARVLQVRGRLGNILAPQFHDIACKQSGTGDYGVLTGLLSVDLAQPWIFSTRNSLGVSIFAERQTLPDIFVRRAVGLRFGLTRAISPQTPLTFFWRPEISQLRAGGVLYCTGFLICAPEDIEALDGTNVLAPIGLSFTRDRTNDLLNPRSGYRLAFDVEYAASWTGSEFRYTRAAVEASSYSQVAGPVVFASRVRAGWVGDGVFSEIVRPGESGTVVHPQKRFFAGGANSVRGFSQGRLGPRVLVADPVALLSPIDAERTGAGCIPEGGRIDESCDANALADRAFDPRPTGGTRVLEANAEVRFPMGSWLEGVAFTDVGQAWGPGQAVGLDDLEFTPGLGLRFPSPVGPIRVDVAYRFRESENLLVVTRQIRPYQMGVDDEDDQLTLLDGSKIPYLLTNDLSELDLRVLFGDTESRIQLHVSIGQAF